MFWLQILDLAPDGGDYPPSKMYNFLRRETTSYNYDATRTVTEALQMAVSSSVAHLSRPTFSTSQYADLKFFLSENIMEFLQMCVKNT
jgi:hypothetical protein